MIYLKVLINLQSTTSVQILPQGREWTLLTLGYGQEVYNPGDG